MRSRHALPVLVALAALLLQGCGNSEGFVATSIAQTLQISDLQTRAAAAGQPAASATGAETATVTATETPGQAQNTVAPPTQTPSSTPTPTPTPTETPCVGPEDFSGHWFTNFGTVDFVQVGCEISGTFFDAFYGNTSSIAGSISGNSLFAIINNDRTVAVGISLDQDGLTFSGDTTTGVLWCGARAGHHFPRRCSFSRDWVTYREPVSECNDVQFRLVRIDNSVSGVYCNNRTLNGTVTYPGNGQVAILEGTLLNQDGVGTKPVRFYLMGYDALQFRGSWDTVWPFCGWITQQPTPCKWP